MKLELENIAKSYDGKLVLENLSLHLDDVRSLVLVGPSGGGKSTLLRILGGLEPATGGGYRLNGREVAFDRDSLLAHRRRIGTVFQKANLFPHLTALENITLPLREVHRVGRKEADERAREILERFRLADHAYKKPADLSGGQNQRIAIARAVSIDPQLILFDEPTSSLDPEMTAEVLSLVEDLKADGKDIVLVTHEIAFAGRMGGHAAFLSGGSIVDFGPTEKILLHPQHPEIANFVEKVLRY